MLSLWSHPLLNDLQLFSSTPTSHGQRGLALDAAVSAAKGTSCARAPSTSAAYSNSSLLGRALQLGSSWRQGAQRGLASTQTRSRDHEGAMVCDHSMQHS
eukprot:1160222-Pelagomonas_calceolata.AAC.16